MAHHQGMSLLSLNYLLQGRPMQRRFETDPLFQATMLLLHERIPKASSFHTQDVDLSGVHDTANDSEMPIRVFKMADTPAPKCNCCRTAVTTSWSPMRAVATVAGKISI